MGHWPRYVTAYAGNDSERAFRGRHHHCPTQQEHGPPCCALRGTGRGPQPHHEPRIQQGHLCHAGAAAQLCARVRTGADDAVVEGLGHFVPLAAPVDCCESGSTLRFLIPIASLTGQAVSFTGRGRLMERPQSVYEALYREQGLRFEQSAAGLTVEGALTPANTALQAMYPASSSAGCCLLCRCFPATARCTSSRRWRAAATSI